MSWVMTAAWLGALGVGLGAFGAHGLRSRLDAAALASWSTAVEYQLLHAVALLAVGLYASGAGSVPVWTLRLWTAGIVLFSGSIYLLVLGGPRWLGPITPVGGICLLAGWVMLGLWVSGISTQR